MELYSVLVTVANTVAGLEFVKQLVGLPKPPRYIFALYSRYRTLEALSEIKESAKNSEVVLIQVGYATKLEEVVEARQIVEKAVGDNGLTLLINTTNYYSPEAFPHVTEKTLLVHFFCNTILPIKIFQEMLPLLQKSASHNSSPSGMRPSRAAVLNISSLLGSITNAAEKYLLNKHELLPYKISKAALNMAMRVIASDVKEHGILVVNMCTEWVDTDTGTGLCEQTPEERISSMLRTLANLDETHHGTYMDGLGKPYPF